MTREHRCDGCGKVAPWDKGWRWWGSLSEDDEDIRRWTACSPECMAKMPVALRDLPTPRPMEMAHASIRSRHRVRIENLRRHTP